MRAQKHTSFTIVEIIVVVGVLMALLIAGGYAWRKEQPRKLHVRSESAGHMLPDSHVIIREWGVQAPYSGLLHLSYTLKGNRVSFSSDELTKVDPRCKGRGGTITRYRPNDDITPTGDDEVRAAQLPPHASSFALEYTGGRYHAVPGDGGNSFTRIGNYYYIFSHDQTACGTSGDISRTAMPQQQTNNDVRQLVPKLVKL